MQESLRKMRQKRANGDNGFTLVELLVVVVIIGILVAIAIPLYLNYRRGAANKTAQSDVRSAITAVEQHYTENGNAYLQTNIGPSTDPLSFGDQRANVSPNNQLSYTYRPATDATSPNTYYICGVNLDGGQVYVYDSAAGGAVKESTTDNILACSSGNGA